MAAKRSAGEDQITQTSTASSLTVKQEAAVQHYLQHGDKSAAYRSAYSAENMSDKTINEKACRLFAGDKVRARVEALREGVAKRHELTVDGLIKQLFEDREFARAHEQPGAAVRATELLGKHLGMFTDVMRHRGIPKVPVMFVRRRDDTVEQVGAESDEDQDED